MGGCRNTFNASPRYPWARYRPHKCSSRALPSTGDSSGQGNYLHPYVPPPRDLGREKSIKKMRNLLKENTTRAKSSNISMCLIRVLPCCLSYQLSGCRSAVLLLMYCWETAFHFTDWWEWGLTAVVYDDSFHGWVSLLVSSCSKEGNKSLNSSWWLNSLKHTSVCRSVCPSYRLAASCLKFRTVSTKFLKALNSATTPWMAPTEAAWPIWLTWARPTSVKEKMGCFQPWWGEHRWEIFFIACEWNQIWNVCISRHR